jgi:V/A-type H+-transporting ATPase subunit D
MLPKGGVTSHIEVEYKNLMSVMVPQFKTGSASAASGRGYGYTFTTSALDEATDGIKTALPDMLRLAQVEKTASLLAAEIERTRRRVNALEYIMIPQLIAAIAEVSMKLDEAERENTTRLMKIKDMAVKRGEGHNG